MSHRFCDCKRCVRLRKREGLVLGTRVMGFWIGTPIVETPQYYKGPVSDYVRHPKFARGVRRPVAAFDARDPLAEY